MSGPVNTIIGDNQPIDLPQAQLSDDQLRDERMMAKFSRTAEFRRLKEHLKERIDHYKHFLPGEIPIESVSQEEREKTWLAADTIIKEFKLIISTYELAGEAVRDAKWNAQNS